MQKNLFICAVLLLLQQKVCAQAQREVWIGGGAHLIMAGLDNKTYDTNEISGSYTPRIGAGIDGFIHWRRAGRVGFGLDFFYLQKGGRIPNVVNIQTEYISIAPQANYYFEKPAILIYLSPYFSVATTARYQLSEAYQPQYPGHSGRNNPISPLDIGISGGINKTIFKRGSYAIAATLQGGYGGFDLFTRLPEFGYTRNWHTSLGINVQFEGSK